MGALVAIVGLLILFLVAKAHQRHLAERSAKISFEALLPSAPEVKSASAKVEQARQSQHEHQAISKDSLGQPATLKMNAMDYVAEQQAKNPRIPAKKLDVDEVLSGVADEQIHEASKFNTPEQNQIKQLIKKNALEEAEEQADQLIYSEPSELNNWLLKLEALAKQNKKD